MSAGVMWLRRRRLPLALIGAAVLAGTVALIVASTGDSGQHPSRAAAAARWQTHTFDGLTFRFPARWHAVTPDFNAIGGTPLGYLVNRKPRPQCRPDGGCGVPMYTEAGNASFVSADELPGYSNFHAITTISGWPAMFRRESRCGHGGTYGISATLSVLTGIIYVNACTASTDPVDRRILDRIIGTLHYTDPSGVTISGRFLRADGSAGSPSQPLPGLVTLEPVGRGQAVVLPTGADGRFSTQILPGRYMISGNSPRVQSGAATCPTVPKSITVRRSTTVDVICEIN